MLILEQSHLIYINWNECWYSQSRQQRVEMVSNLVLGPSIEIGENYLLDIYPFIKVINKHNYNEISLDWYNCLDFMNNGCEIKII